MAVVTQTKIDCIFGVKTLVRCVTRQTKLIAVRNGVCVTRQSELVQCVFVCFLGCMVFLWFLHLSVVAGSDVV